MSGEDWDLQWAPPGPGVRLQGSPLWFDVWPRDGVGFLSSLDALDHRRIRGPVICSSLLASLLRVVRPRARVLPLEGPIGLGRLRLSCWPTGTTPGASGLLVERAPRRLAYLVDGDARTLVHRGAMEVVQVDTVLWWVTDGGSSGGGIGTSGGSEGLGTALQRLIEGEKTGVIEVSPPLHALCRAGRRLGLALPETRTRKGAFPASGDEPKPRGERPVLAREGVSPDDLVRVSRQMGARRLVLAGPGARQMQRHLAGRGIPVETLGPVVVPVLL